MDRKLIVKIQLFELPQYFYIKPSEKGAREESAARFDLLQYICLDHLHPVQNEKTSSKFGLSKVLLTILFNHLCRYFFDKPYNEVLDQEMQAYRDIMMDDESIRKVLAG
jgi:hypothetical protein